MKSAGSKCILKLKQHIDSILSERITGVAHIPIEIILLLACILNKSEVGPRNVHVRIHLEYISKIVILLAIADTPERTHTVLQTMNLLMQIRPF